MDGLASSGRWRAVAPNLAVVVVSAQVTPRPEELPEGTPFVGRPFLESSVRAPSSKPVRPAQATGNLTPAAEAVPACGVRSPQGSAGDSFLQVGRSFGVSSVEAASPRGGPRSKTIHVDTPRPGDDPLPPIGDPPPDPTTARGRSACAAAARSHRGPLGRPGPTAARTARNASATCAAERVYARGRSRACPPGPARRCSRTSGR